MLCHPITFGNKTYHIIRMSYDFTVRIKLPVQICLALCNTDYWIIHQFFSEHPVMALMTWYYYLAGHGERL